MTKTKTVLIAKTKSERNSRGKKHNHLPNSCKWKYYDFEKNWDTFYNVWQSKKAQDILEKQMKVWCKEEAYYNNGEKPVWKRGDDLWRYSRTDYHMTRIDERVEAEMEELGVVMNYDDDNFDEEKYKALENELYDKHKPQKGTYEAQILVMGANYLISTLFYCAGVMFPNCKIEVRSGDGGEVVVLPDKHLVFDFVRLWREGPSNPSDFEGWKVLKRNKILTE
ncbi:elongation factor Ts [Acrasis kona]|uniref:Elongation factor Ts n=1 Tax=Acrasis kona TaxID=1008807 RepID=A0AAW2ZIP8_9EUKA